MPAYCPELGGGSTAPTFLASQGHYKPLASGVRDRSDYRMTKRKSKTAPMVLVTWVDAGFSTSPHWNDGAIPERPKKKSHNICVSVGFLVHADDEWVQLVTTLTEGQHAHVTEIPRGMTRSIAVLKSDGELES